MYTIYQNDKKERFIPSSNLNRFVSNALRKNKGNSNKVAGVKTTRPKKTQQSKKEKKEKKIALSPFFP